MTSYPQLASQFAEAIENCLPDILALQQAGQQTDLLALLIDAIPYYGNASFEQIHRAALANLLEVYLPNNMIAPSPDDTGFGYITSYSYNGSFSGYQNAFYNGVFLSATAKAVATQVQSAHPSLNTTWWGNYGVTVLTDAIRIALSLSLDTSKLSNDLASNNSTFLPALSASYLAVYTTGYQPTAAALSDIINTDQALASAESLASAITHEQFTSNINQAIAMGGDSTNAVTWFLFNLWITLQALGASDVNGIIMQAQNAGLTVPAQVGPGSWWSGGYTSWYIALSGSDLSSQASATIAADMPEEAITAFSSEALPISQNVMESNGYAKSLCIWGNLNWYNPQPSSCFGKGTQILMADGSTKAIETIQVGDEVQSNLGNKKVVLISSPKRLGRPLYQINELKVFATAGHPFHAGQDVNGMRIAIDPWMLIDSLPTMTEAGVSTLREAVTIVGFSEGRFTDVLVAGINEHLVSDDNERVYNLWLDNWQEGSAMYFVGGPDYYLAADAEIADANYDLPCTMAIMSAMYVAIDMCRNNFPHPEMGTAMFRAIADLTPSILSMQVPAIAPLREGTVLPRLPDTSFFQQNGEWDCYASFLVEQLIRFHARSIRRRLYDPLENDNNSRNPNDRLGIYLRDIELLGEFGVISHSILSLELRLRICGVDEDNAQWITLDTSDSMRWFIIYDDIIYFDYIPPRNEVFTIIGRLLQDNISIGFFRFNIGYDAVLPLNQEYFIYNDANKIIGRIAFDLIHTGINRPLMLKMLMHSSNQTRLMHSALLMGQQLGQDLNQMSGKFANLIKRHYSSGSGPD